MYAPIRLVYGLRPRASPGLLAAAFVASTVFLVTPFLLPELVERFDVSLGVAGLLSTAQVGSFAAASFFGGRRLRPTKAILVGAGAALLVANVASVLVPWFWALTVLRMAAGGAAGLMTWSAWADSAGHSRRLSDVAAIGPIGAIALTPVIAALAQAGGDRAVFAAMAVVGAVGLLIPVHLATVTRDEAPVRRQRISPSRSNRVLLVALSLATLFGSSVYIFAATVAQQRIGLTATAASIGYSLNAATGLIAARITTRKTWAGWWMVGILASVLTVALVDNAVAYFAAMGVWGFCFWMAVPRVLRMLAEKSYSPDERIGDAQAGMALGRAIGPATGAAFLAGATVGVLGVFAAAGLGVVAIAMLAVEGYRRNGGDADILPVVKAVIWRFNGD